MTSWRKKTTAWLGLLAALVLLLPVPLSAQALHPLSDKVVATHMNAARAGKARDQFLVGLMYERGRGLPQDYAQAAYWYGEAAKQGNTPARLSLGNLYDKGLGVPQNYKTALAWYRLAAAGGDGQAMYFVGSMTYNGEGAKADHAAAATWFRRATAAGFKPAKAAYDKVMAEMQKSAPTAPAPAPAPPPKAQPATPPAPVAAAPAASANPASAASDADAPPAGVYAVQVGAFASHAMAQTAWTRLRRKLPDRLRGQKAQIYRIILSPKRTFFRLNAGHFAQKADARALCVELKARQIDCLVIHY